MQLYWNATAHLINPNRLRSYVVLKEQQIAYGRIPKAANSSIKLSLYHALVGSEDRKGGVNKDEFWRHKTEGKTDLLTARALRRQYPEVFTFSFTRNPFSRISSCYFEKIVRRNRAPRLFRYQGFTQDMSFAQFVEKIAAIGDGGIDIHVCSQTYLLGMKKGVTPCFVGQVEKIDRDWVRLNQALGDAGKPQLGPPRILNKARQERPSDAEMYADPGLVRLVQERYRDDFEHFYPNADRP